MLHDIVEAVEGESSADVTERVSCDEAERSRCWGEGGSSIALTVRGAAQGGGWGLGGVLHPDDEGSPSLEGVFGTRRGTRSTALGTGGRGKRVGGGGQIAQPVPSRRRTAIPRSHPRFMPSLWASMRDCSCFALFSSTLRYMSIPGVPSAMALARRTVTYHKTATEMQASVMHKKRDQIIAPRPPNEYVSLCACHTPCGPPPPPVLATPLSKLQS